ncbi:hypothetical protein, partial [Salmonella enterica]|uniref:hypothetical protein n=1 Tax=Salmonella enterica TaxID=28901 RepID=UPI0026289B5F
TVSPTFDQSLQSLSTSFTCRYPERDVFRRVPHDQVTVSPTFDQSLQSLSTSFTCRYPERDVFRRVPH